MNVECCVQESTRLALLIRHEAKISAVERKKGENPETVATTFSLRLSLNQSDVRCE